MRAFVLFLTIMLTTACGAGAGSEQHIKDYRFTIPQTDRDLRFQAEDLIATYNEQAGFEALRIATSEGDANSTLTFKNGLYSEEGKLGYGRWITQAGSGANLVQSVDKVVLYSMELLFDADFVREHVDAPKGSAAWEELYLLFCHEVGHGLQMNHADDQDDVMYYVIDSPEQAKFAEYFKNVQAFFGR